MAGKDDDIEIPKEFTCPITNLLMMDPVIAADNHTYEREALVKWYEENDTSPKTGIEVPHTDFTPNTVLLMNIEEWKRKTGYMATGGGGGNKEEEEAEEASEESTVTSEDADPQRKIDRAALEDLYAEANGDTCWENIDGWDEGEKDLNEWWGVTLSSHESEEDFPGIPLGSLIRLKLVQNGLQGELPSSIANFKNLVILNLYYNFLEGEIPDIFGKLRNLMKLDLSRNRFTGPIPASIGKLLRLEKLVLQNNLLTGEVPMELMSLTALKYFDISRNDLTGEVPEDVGYMEPLTVLMVNDNRFTGILPETVTLLTNLEKLTVQFNEFEIDPHVRRRIRISITSRNFPICYALFSLIPFFSCSFLCFGLTCVFLFHLGFG